MFLFFIFFFTVLSCYGFGQFKAADQIEGNSRFAHHDCLFNDLMEQIDFHILLFSVVYGITADCAYLE